MPVSKSETNCVDAVSEALSAGGIDVNGRDMGSSFGYWGLFQHPGALNRELKNISKINKNVDKIK